MGDISISTDDLIIWEWNWVKLNGTIVYTWIVMLVLVLIAWSVQRRLSSKQRPTSWQRLIEYLVETIQGQIGDISGQRPGPFVPFIGTLFLLIAAASLMGMVPGFQPPTASLSTTSALAACVFLAVPYYGIRQQGFRSYAQQYLKPTWLMLPFNIIGELSRTLALAIRLYGNMMSGAVIGAVLLAFMPLFVPVAMQLLGLITGMIQAYIFAVLAMVYIASAIRVRQKKIDQEITKQGELEHG